MATLLTTAVDVDDGDAGDVNETLEAVDAGGFNGAQVVDGERHGVLEGVNAPRGDRRHAQHLPRA